jgi:hypothetical protein
VTETLSQSPARPIVWPDQTAGQTPSIQPVAARAVAEGAALSAPRLVWPGDEAETTPDLIEAAGLGMADEEAAATSVWTDQTGTRPTRFSWRRVWGFLLMGGFGLVSLAMAMAALRKASMATSDVQSILAIAGVLAVIGLACVGVSAHNIYQRLSDDR